MAPTPLTVTSLTHTTATLWDPAAFSAGNATDGNTIPNSEGRTLLAMNNSGASSRTVNVRVTKTVDGLSLAATARQYTLAAGEVRVVKLGPISDYGTEVLVTPSHAEVKFKAFSL